MSYRINHQMGFQASPEEIYSILTANAPFFLRFELLLRRCRSYK
jgi:hypothetical protein